MIWSAVDLMTFNRTIKELKLQSGQRRGSILDTFNRTIKELKPAQAALSEGQFGTFNRTIKELKSSPESSRFQAGRADRTLVYTIK